MNSTFESGTSAAGTASHNRLSARAIVTRYAALSFAVAFGAGLTGCSILKPTESTARYFVLKPMPATAPVPVASNSMAVGLGQVKLPAHLLNTSLAVSKGTNEIEYLPSAFWAERLDTGFQRVLAVDLAAVLPAEQVRLSSWQSEDVAAEVQLTVEQFDVDAKGQGVLIAQWRILSPGGEKLLKAGATRLSRQGPSPGTNPSGAVTTLSELVTDLSRQLAQSLREATSAQAPPAAK
jgi:uncharacterized lipoprotein YmbA